jgi:hypothetical protein
MKDKKHKGAGLLLKKTAMLKLSRAQELLDEGNSPTKVASILDVHHSKILRLISKGNLEIYLAFDEKPQPVLQDEVICLSTGYSFECEDELEMITDEVYDKGYYYLDVDKHPIVRKYVRKMYGSLIQYLKIKNMKYLTPMIHLKCAKCNQLVSLEMFTTHKTQHFGIDQRCKGCRGKYLKNHYVENRSSYIRQAFDWRIKYPAKVNIFAARYQKNNPEKVKVNHQRRAARKRLLNNKLSNEDWLSCLRFFNCACALSDMSGKLDMEHFIALSTGHGGTYLGNVYPLNSSMNQSKGGKNPFEWIRTRPDIDANRFAEVVAYLADLNGLTVDQYRQFVNWCYDKPRAIEQIDSDNRRYGHLVSSVSLWKEYAA